MAIGAFSVAADSAAFFSPQVAGGAGQDQVTAAPAPAVTCEEFFAAIVPLNPEWMGLFGEQPVEIPAPEFLKIFDPELFNKIEAMKDEGWQILRVSSKVLDAPMVLHASDRGKAIFVSSDSGQDKVRIALELAHQIGHIPLRGCDYDVSSEAAFIESWKYHEARALFFQAGRYHTIVDNAKLKLNIDVVELDPEFDGLFSERSRLGDIYLRHRSDPEAGIRAILKEIETNKPMVNRYLTAEATARYQQYQQALAGANR